MPLHKTSRGPRLDPTMISAPLGDFRHTMHIGRGGDVFGDTSFLSSHGPSSPSTKSEAGTLSCTSPEPPTNSNVFSDTSPQPCELHQSESSEILSLDLDLDLGPSILGDVLGVMDGLMLDSGWSTGRMKEESGSSFGAEELSWSEKESLVSIRNDVNGKEGSLLESKVEGQISAESSLKVKGSSFRPKVRFSDKREEIIDQEVDGVGLDQHRNELECISPSDGEYKKGNFIGSYSLRRQDREGEPSNHVADSPPSPASSHSSEYEGVTSLDRRREDNHLAETESDEELVGSEQGYTFEDEFDDEIGL
ncbi:cdc42 effector protein 5 [Paramormyrops kingsleyae]|uniref:CDC42 effector protein (Rho GTPase binding) 5 n=1 Tax=Paramormyrops kingsleyae TaxID=1676925 RepID=A0A3B3SM45_9TELE|nr:cdc42 effector protein 5 [Paramormyrops kingsleyae]